MQKTTTKKEKIECTNPNTGRTMQIDADTWNLFYAAITHSLKGGKKLTFTQLVEAIEDYLEKKKIDFKQSVGWYAVTVKHDLHVRKILNVFTENGAKLHQLNPKNASR
jgi:hypothetical protein